MKGGSEPSKRGGKGLLLWSSESGKEKEGKPQGAPS